MSKFLSKLTSSLELTRWNLNIDYSIILTLFGTIAALNFNFQNIDWKLLVFAILVNLFANFGTFAINDIADYKDDAQDPKKKVRNPISAGRLTIKESWIIYMILTSISLFSAFLIYNQTKQVEIIILACLINLLGYLYSVKPARLKDVPILDILSHGLFLGGLQVLIGFFTYSKFISIQAQPLILLAGAATFISFYGQMTNQIKDYEVDKLTQVKSTTQKFGLEIARFIKFASLAVATGLVLPLIITNRIPNEYIFYFFINLFLSLIYVIVRTFLFKSKKQLAWDINRASLFATLMYLLGILTKFDIRIIVLNLILILLALLFSYKSISK